MVLKKLISAVAAWLAAALLSGSALAADPIRLGLIEPFSGPIAAVGLDTMGIVGPVLRRGL